MRNFSIDIIWAKIQTAFTALGAWLGLFLGGVDGLLYALIIFAVIDYITGVMVAIVNKKLSSAIGFKGIAKKTLLFALVGVAHTLDKHVVGGGAALRTATIFYELSNEGLSILENSTCLGLPVPEKL
ncbi:MAG: phage holin family protein, partial [Clostridia bacterium]|nr:phage holin family protein [Clostridia bacterium]